MNRIDLRNRHGVKIGTAELRGNDYIIRNVFGMKSGMAEKGLLSNDYRIKDNYGNTVFRVEKNFFGPDSTVRDNFGNKIGTISPSAPMGNGAAFALLGFIIIVIISFQMIGSNIASAFSDFSFKNESFVCIAIPFFITTILSSVLCVKLPQQKKFFGLNTNSFTFMKALLVVAGTGLAAFIAVFSIYISLELIINGNLLENIFLSGVMFIMLIPSYLAVLVPTTLTCSLIIITLQKAFQKESDALLEAAAACFASDLPENMAANDSHSGTDSFTKPHTSLIYKLPAWKTFFNIVFLLANRYLFIYLLENQGFSMEQSSRITQIISTVTGGIFLGVVLCSIFSKSRFLVDLHILAPATYTLSFSAINLICSEFVSGAVYLAVTILFVILNLFLARKLQSILMERNNLGALSFAAITITVFSMFTGLFPYLFNNITLADLFKSYFTRETIIFYICQAIIGVAIVKVFLKKTETLSA